MSSFGLNFQTIASIVLGLLAIGSWVLYGLVGVNGSDFVRFFMPVANSILSMFALGYVIDFVIDANCPIADPDDCAGEAGLVLVIFLSTFSVTATIIFCVYKCITGEISF